MLAKPHYHSYLLLSFSQRLLTVEKVPLVSLTNDFHVAQRLGTAGLIRRLHPVFSLILSVNLGDHQPSNVIVVVQHIEVFRFLRSEPKVYSDQIQALNNLIKNYQFFVQENQEGEVMLPKNKEQMQYRKVKAIIKLCLMLSSYLFNPKERLYSLNQFGKNRL